MGNIPDVETLASRELIRYLKRGILREGTELDRAIDLVKRIEKEAKVLGAKPTASSVSVSIPGGGRV